MRPVLFSVAGFDVFAAPVFAGLALFTAFLCFRSFKRRMGLSLEDFWNLVFVMALGVIGGALLFYAVLYNGGLANNLPFLIETKRIPGGSFWGSFWTVFACAYIYCRAKGIEFKRVADSIGLSAVLSLAVMRLGCFQHGCCHGIPTALRWGVRYTDPRCAAAKSLLGKTLHPSQLYEALGSLEIFFIVYFVFLKSDRLKPGGAFVLSVVFYSILRFALDFVRAGDPGIFWAHHLTTAQLISIASAAGSVLWYRRS
jgi:phosphatidylglycerol:prolipoprotein diacylglycerol transferase